jgi:hypothetical protein
VIQLSLAGQGSPGDHPLRRGAEIGGGSCGAPPHIPAMKLQFGRARVAHANGTYTLDIQKKEWELDASFVRLFARSTLARWASMTRRQAAQIAYNRARSVGIV